MQNPFHFFVPRRLNDPGHEPLVHRYRDGQVVRILLKGTVVCYCARPPRIGVIGDAYQHRTLNFGDDEYHEGVIWGIHTVHGPAAESGGRPVGSGLFTSPPLYTVFWQPGSQEKWLLYLDHTLLLPADGVRFGQRVSALLYRLLCRLIWRKQPS